MKGNRDTLYGDIRLCDPKHFSNFKPDSWIELTQKDKLGNAIIKSIKKAEISIVMLYGAHGDLIEFKSIYFRTPDLYQLCYSGKVDIFWYDVHVYDTRHDFCSDPIFIVKGDSITRIRLGFGFFNYKTRLTKFISKRYKVNFKRGDFKTVDDEIKYIAEHG